MSSSAVEEPRRRLARRGGRFGAPIGVLIVGVVVTGTLTWLSQVLYSNNESRLLRLRARDASSIVTAAVPGIQTPLASSAALADATGADRKDFVRFITPYVGTGPGREFVSVSLWRLRGGSRGPIAVVGTAPLITRYPGRARAFLAHAVTSPTLSVIGMLQGPSPRLGYGFSGRGVRGPFAAYGESALPRSRYSPAQSNSSFSDLDYVIYLGRSPHPKNLLITSVKHLPLMGQSSSVRAPFGNTFLTLTVTARRPLTGSLPQRLPWAIGIAGGLLTLGAFGLTMRLTGRRRYAEGLAMQLEEVAEENRRLFTEQRGIAQTLQRALLPDVLPQLPGLETGARYEPGVQGVEIGGDWYDLIVLDEDRLLLVIGDVSGRGLRAATTMASLRYAIRAYAAQDDSPSVIVSKLSELVSVQTTGELATVLCALVDVRARELSVVNAGHLPPLLISNGHGEFVQAKVGLPVGVERHAAYSPTTVSAPAGATFLAFTDGLVERRGENIDVGLSRLRDHAAGGDRPLGALLNHVVDGLRDDAGVDDTAIAAIRWLT